jgi:hypothetical protein
VPLVLRSVHRRLGAEVDRTRPGVFQNGPCLESLDDSDSLLSFHGPPGSLEAGALDIRTLVQSGRMYFAPILRRCSLACWF